MRQKSTCRRRATPPQRGSVLHGITLDESSRRSGTLEVEQAAKATAYGADFGSQTAFRIREKLIESPIPLLLSPLTARPRDDKRGTFTDGFERPNPRPHPQKVRKPSRQIGWSASVVAKLAWFNRQSFGLFQLPLLEADDTSRSPLGFYAPRKMSGGSKRARILRRKRASVSKAPPMDYLGDFVL